MRFHKSQKIEVTVTKITVMYPLLKSLSCSRVNVCKILCVGMQEGFIMCNINTKNAVLLCLLLQDEGRKRHYI
jgi:hypothetical protein